MGSMYSCWVWRQCQNTKGLINVHMDYYEFAITMSMHGCRYSSAGDLPGRHAHQYAHALSGRFSASWQHGDHSPSPALPACSHCAAH